MNVRIGEEEFSFSGKRVTDPGFTGVMTWQAIPPEESMPQVEIYKKNLVRRIRSRSRNILAPRIRIRM